MAWTTPPTFTAGAPLPAADLNKLSGDLNALGGSGVEILRGSASLDFPSIAGPGRQSLTITVTGASVGDDVTAHSDSITAGLILQAWVSSANTVTVACNNYSGSSIDPAAFTVRVNVFKFH